MSIIGREVENIFKMAHLGTILPLCQRHKSQPKQQIVEQTRGGMLNTQPFETKIIYSTKFKI